jgi:hypothetical protein
MGPASRNNVSRMNNSNSSVTKTTTSSNQRIREVPPALVARIGFQYFRNAEVAGVDMGNLLSVLRISQEVVIVGIKKTTACEAMVLRFLPDSREISFRLDDCPTRNRFGGYSPSEYLKCTA